jgi:uncharacterized Tic20 family protein
MCDVCGSDVPTGANCPVCGAALPDLPTDPADPAPAADARPTDAPPTDGAPSLDGVTAPPPPPAASAPSYAPVPATVYRRPTQDPSHPSGLADWVRTWGVFTHLSAFLAAFFALAFVGPLVMWLIHRDDHPFLDHHGKEALNFNLSMLLYGVIGVAVSIVTIGIGLIVVIPLGLALFVTWVVAPIIAATKASRGEGYRYPVTIRFIAD